MLSNLIQVINRLIVQPCMEEDESYAIRSRKLCSISVAVIAFNAFILAVPFTYITRVYDASFTNYYVVSLLYFVVFTCSIIPYGYVRYTKKLPDWVVELQIWTAMFCTSSLLLFVHQGSVTIGGTCAALMGLILRVRAWPLVLLCAVAFNVMHALINDFGDVLPELHETFYSNQLLSVRLMFLFGGSIFPFLLFGVGLHVIMKEFVQRSEQADAAIAMNLAVAAKLRRYDTDGVAEILAANKGKVDENLLEAFTAIQHNLQEYRPHIPDYIIAATTTEPTEGSLVGVEELHADDDDEGDHSHSINVSEHNTSGRYSSSSVGIMESSTRSGGANRSQGSNSMPSSPSIIHQPSLLSFRHPSSTNHNHHLGDNNHHRNSSSSHNNNNNTTTGNTPILTLSVSGDENSVSGYVVLGGSGQDEVRSGRAVIDITNTSNNPTDERHRRQHRNNGPIALEKLSSVAGAATRGRRNTDKLKEQQQPTSKYTTSIDVHNAGAVRGHVGAAKAYTGQATTVFIRFIAGACGSLRGTDGTVPRGSHTSTVVEYLGLGVEAAARHAKLHGGAMQYMQGCGLMVSFNAASRVNAHESKACAFALALKAEMEALPTSTLTLHATIVTTPVMSFFAGKGGQLMLTVLGGYMPIHTALHHYLSQTVGDDVSCILISKTTLPSVEVHYEARMLGAVGMSSLSENIQPVNTTDGSLSLNSQPMMGTQTDVIQLVCARKAKESDEWMYELENQTSTHGFTKMIVYSATNGDLKAAMSIVNQHETAIHNDTLLSRCLHDRIESCIEDSTVFPLHTAPPTKMW